MHQYSTALERRTCSSASKSWKTPQRGDPTTTSRRHFIRVLFHHISTGVTAVVGKFLSQADRSVVLSEPLTHHLKLQNNPVCRDLSQQLCITNTVLWPRHRPSSVCGREKVYRARFLYEHKSTQLLPVSPPQIHTAAQKWLNCCCSSKCHKITTTAAQ